VLWQIGDEEETQMDNPGEFNVPPITAGDHKLTITFSSGDGFVWDFIRLETICP